MYEELVKAHKTELRLASLQIERRTEWANLLRVDRLERALKTARARLHVLPHFSAEAN